MKTGDHSKPPLNEVEITRQQGQSESEQTVSSSNRGSSLTDAKNYVPAVHEFILALAAAPSTTDLLPVIAENLKLQTGALAAGVCSYSPSTRELVIRYIATDESNITSAQRLLGRQLIGFRLHLSPELEHRMLTEVIATPEDLSEMSFGFISKVIGKAIQKVLGVDELAGLSLHYQNELMGSVFLIMPQKRKLPALDILHVFAHIGAIALHRKNYEEALEESEKKWHLLYENLPGGSFMVNNQYIIEDVNDKLCGITGYQRQELIGQTCDIICPKGPHYCPIFDIGKQRIHNDETAVKTRNGELVPIIKSAIRLSFGDKEVIVENFQDITECKRAETEKIKLEEQLRQAQKIEAIGRLAGGIAHDFNNLLTAILGNVELLLVDFNKNDPRCGELKDIETAAIRAVTLTRQLLAFSRKQSIQPELINLNEFIGAMQKMLRRLISEDIQIITEFGKNLYHLETDPGQLVQIIMNLVVNASDAMPAGGKITIKTENIHLDQTAARKIPEARPGQYVCLSIADTGVGIDDHTQDHLFEPFFSTKELGQGTGLGLSVVYGIVKQHQGWINVFSEPTQGALFKIYLPAIIDISTLKPKPPVLIQNLRGNAERILFIEDDAAVRKLTKRALSENGYIVFVAEDAHNALTIFEAEKGNFDLVFSDVVLPDCDGLQLIDTLLRRKSSLKILLSSGYTDHKSQWQYVQQKGLPYLPKPYSLPALLEMVRKVLGQPQLDPS